MNYLMSKFTSALVKIAYSVSSVGARSMLAIGYLYSMTLTDMWAACHVESDISVSVTPLDIAIQPV